MVLGIGPNPDKSARPPQQLQYPLVRAFIVYRSGISYLFRVFLLFLPRHPLTQHPSPFRRLRLSV